MVRAAVGQFAPGIDKSANISQVQDLVAAAARSGADLVVLPEYSLLSVAVTDQRLLTSAEPLDGPFVRALAALSTEHRISVVAGMNEVLGDDPSRISNTLVAIEPAGAVVATYRKLHLYDAFGSLESAAVRPGAIEAPQTFTVGGATFGMQTCYDLRFPEVTRRLVDAGAEVVLLPAQWVPGPLKEDHWVTLLRARAIESTVFVAAAGQSAPAGSGRSMIIDPAGVVLASLGEQVGTVGADLERSRLEQVRADNPALRMRRFAVVPRR